MKLTFELFINDASRQHAIYKMRVFVLASKFGGFSKVLYWMTRTRLR